MWRVEDGWRMGSQSNGGWVEDSLAAVKCKGRGEGRDKSKNDSRGSVKLLKALPFPGRQFVLHAAESTSCETEYHLERAPRSWGGGGGWKSGPALTSFLEAWLERSKDDSLLGVQGLALVWLWRGPGAVQKHGGKPPLSLQNTPWSNALCFGKRLPLLARPGTRTRQSFHEVTLRKEGDQERPLRSEVASPT